ncbi:unnamed protein product [Ceratitis capitata]|uniref:(Mediterranean fruit fly) hypothetical protein n=1 Tax=Ceratitis capitata TaxID=7213 RepID=A0A811VDY2_CERCA|nr:unnamed protein product [Ceratitis capitata]
MIAAGSRNATTAAAAAPTCNVNWPQTCMTAFSSLLFLLHTTPTVSAAGAAASRQAAANSLRRLTHFLLGYYIRVFIWFRFSMHASVIIAYMHIYICMNRLTTHFSLWLSDSKRGDLTVKWKNIVQSINSSRYVRANRSEYNKKNNTSSETGLIKV